MPCLGPSKSLRTSKSHKWFKSCGDFAEWVNFVSGKVCACSLSSIFSFGFLETFLYWAMTSNQSCFVIWYKMCLGCHWSALSLVTRALSPCIIGVITSLSIWVSISCGRVHSFPGSSMAGVCPLLAASALQLPGRTSEKHFKVTLGHTPCTASWLLTPGPD